jgi:hypothetical protein
MALCERRFCGPTRKTTLLTALWLLSKEFGQANLSTINRITEIVAEAGLTSETWSLEPLLQEAGQL